MLGPLEARRAGRPLRLGSIKHRMLLAKLLLHANQVISTDELIDTVWGEQPPPTVRQSLQNHVAALRRVIEQAGTPAGQPRTLLTRDPGYLLQVDPDQIDLHRFRRMVDQGRAALEGGERRTATKLLHEAVALWRGPALADVVAAGVSWPELAGIDELEIGAVEARIEADLVAGRHAELIGEVDEPTGEADERDPEDVSTMLDRNLERMRAEVSGFGGCVEHAIGGTTMAVFGVPQTHEDDPERAVRAALAIRDALGGEVELRIAVATGEALVTPGGGPTRVAGDLVTTCARLQQAAPPGSVLVSEATERATSRVISYGPASLLALAGRAKPVTVWSALEPRNRTGVDALAASRPVPLVGRDRELGTLLDAFERARVTRSPQMVTLVGQAGIGKSRLVAELWRAVEADRELIAWRQGRSTPYGEGVTFGALGEIIKAEAGILETDSPDRIYRKIAQATEYALGGDHSGAAWVSAHLRLLLGAADERSIQPARQDEAFAAWRRFLQSLAARRPLVLVVEDLHCADDALLTFIQSLLDRSGGPVGDV